MVVLGEVADPMTEAPVAAQLTALTRPLCAVSTDIVNVPPTRLVVLLVVQGLVASSTNLPPREGQVDTAKLERGHKMAAKTKLGVNLVVPGSTKDRDSTKYRTTALLSIKAPTRDRISTRGQVQAIVAVQIRVSTRAQTTTKGQVGSATTTMATQLLHHPALMLS